MMTNEHKRVKGSLISAAVLKRDILRSSVVWGLYLLLLAVILLQVRRGDGSSVRAVIYKLQVSLWQLPLIYGPYGFLCACVLYSDLFRRKSASGMHMLPLKRECWFFTHLLAGMLFFLVPTWLFSRGLTAAVEQQYKLGDLWLFLCGAQFLFFFATGVFCVMLTGNVPGALGCFGLLHYLPYVLRFLWAAVCAIMGKSSVVDFGPFAKLFPAVRLMEFQYIFYGAYCPNESASCQTLLTVQEEWSYLWWLIVAAILFLAAALLLLRRRKIDPMGELLTIGRRRPAIRPWMRKCAVLDTALLKKNIRRYAPIWGVYLLLLTIMLLQIWEIGAGAATSAASAITYKLYYRLWQTPLIYGPFGTLCACLLFSKERASDVLYGGSRWLTQLATGLLFFLIPTWLFGRALTLTLGKWYVLGYLYILLSSIQFLFFFGMGAFCVALAKKWWKALIACGFVHYLGYALHLLGIGIAALGGRVPFLEEKGILRLFPATKLMEFTYFEMKFTCSCSTGFEIYMEPGQWRYLAVLAAAALLLLATAMFLLWWKEKKETRG